MSEVKRNLEKELQLLSNEIAKLTAEKVAYWALYDEALLEIKKLKEDKEQ